MALTKVSTDGVKDDAITSGKIPANAVANSELADDAVTGAKIADTTVDTNNIVNNSVTTVKLADQAVTLDKLPHGTSSNDGKFLRANNGADPTFETISTTPADGSITEAKLASGAVTQTKIGDGSIINAKVDNAAAIAGTKISPDFGNQNIINQADVKIGSKLITRQQSGGHFYLKNNSSGANYSSHFQTYSGGENDNVQTYIHYYHGGYCELLHQGSTAIRTRSGGGVDFYNGNTRIGIFDPEGLKFGTDTSSSNALDDYEEGNWSPTLHGTWYNSGTFRNTTYTKIGRLITCHFDLFQSSNNMGWQANASIRGWPYAAISGTLTTAALNTFSYTSGDAKRIPNYVDDYTNAQMVLHTHSQSSNIRHLLCSLTYMTT